ncbi:hypothetical protein GCM10027062_27730 [Nocardioides hungaricus]
MIVLVLVVLGVVVVRGLFRETPEYVPEPVDYLALVSSIQLGGDLSPAYPARLPGGWIVKDASFTPGDRPALDLAMSTDEGDFAGLRQEDQSVGELVRTYVGADATEGEPVRLDSAVAREWQTFTDPGGDTAFAAEVGDETVLVWGSAPAEALRGLVESLTTAPVSGPIS